MRNIDWQDANIGKPPVDISDAYSHKNNESKEVLLWVKDHNNGDNRCRFGRYLHNHNHWIIVGVTGGKYEVTHYAEINEPII